MTKKHYLGIGLSIGTSVFFLYLALRQVNLAEVLAAMSHANYWYLIPSSLVTIAAFMIRGLRWQTLMQPIQKISYRNSFGVLMIGFMAINLLPLRMGEFVRPYLIGTKIGVSRTASLATVVLERIFDVVSLLILMGMCLFYSPKFPDTVRLGGLALGVLVIFLLVFFWVLSHYQEKVVNIFNRIISPVSEALAEKISNLLHKFINGLEVMKNGRQLFLVIIYSTCVWVLSSYIFWFVGLAFGFNMQFMDSVFVMVIVALGILIPSSPGFVGTFQYFCVLALMIVSITSKDIALSYSIVLNISQFAVIVSIGFFFLWLEGISFSELKKAEEVEEAAV